LSPSHERRVDRFRQLGGKRGFFDDLKNVGAQIIDKSGDLIDGVGQKTDVPADIVNGGLDAISKVGDSIRGDNKDTTAAAAAAVNLGPAPPPNWMQANLPTLGGRTLRNLAIPGSHDAGMSSFNESSKTGFATEANTRTQTLDLAGQLAAGARYFDIRPAISGGVFRAGHYSFVPPIQSFQGANGQLVNGMIDQINAFTKDNKELIILNLSHDLNTDLPNGSFRPFDQGEYDRLFNDLLRLENRFVAPGDPTTVDLTTLKLNDFIGGGKAAVVLIVEPTSISLGDFAQKGFYKYAQFNAFNSFADKDDANAMIEDQLNKLNQQRPANYFLLSWTATQQNEQVIVGPSILEFADRANALIFTKLTPALSNDKFPNIVYVDDFRSEFTSLTLQINQRFQA
jgi:hypothetical protein